MELVQTYEHTISALGAMALLMLLQVLVADVIGIRSKHTPGASINTDHGDLLFRASRTVANTNESIAVFIIATMFCIFSNASVAYTAYAVWGFTTARAFYALFYYLNLQIMRSSMFGISLVCLAALLLIGASA